MRGLTRRWVLRGTDDEAPDGDLRRRILAARGITGAEEIEAFCDPRLTHLSDPGPIPGMEEAVERILRATRAGESIVLYGDYDVDGITATAILYHTIRALDGSARVGTYVPHRLEEGYGLNGEALERLRADGADLVVTVDCGITAVAEAARARALGLDLVITDHHNLPATGPLPDAILVHPRRPGSTYPFGDLCGAGVAFKLAWRMATAWCGSQRVSAHLQRHLLSMLPLVALGTIADVVPLHGENRVLTSHGLRLIRQTALPGLRALLEAAKLMDERVDCQKVGFVLAPRLNACGRMGHASEAVRMLTEAPAEEATEIAARLTSLNEQRRRTEAEITAQAVEMAEAAGMTGDDRRAIVLAHEQWHPGVIGIVCSRLVQRYGRPTVLLQRQGAVCKGSARSIDGYSIHDGLQATASWLGTYGGHDAAAGLSLPSENLDPFTAALVEHANAHITVDELTPVLPIDCDAGLVELRLEVVERLAALGPFGRGNRRPTIRVRDVVVAEPPRQIGRQGRHLALRVRAGSGRDRRLLRCLWWDAGDLAPRLAPGVRLDIAIEPRVNSFNGRTTVEAELRDVIVHGRSTEAAVIEPRAARVREGTTA